MHRRIIGILVLMIFHVIANASELDDYPELTIGLNSKLYPDLTPTDSQQALKLIDKDLSKFARLRVSHINYDDLDKMYEDFEKGVINFISLPPIAFLKYLNNDKLSNGLTIINQGQFLDALLVVSRKNEGISTFSDLEDRNMSVLEGDKLSEIYLKTLIYRSRSNKSCFLTDITKVKNSQRLVLQLFFKQTDAIIVYRSQLQLSIEMNPAIAQNLKVIAKYENVPRGISFFSKSVSRQLREYFIARLLEFQHTIRGEQLLILFKSDELRPSNWKDLEAVKKLYEEYQLLKNKAKNKQHCLTYF